MNIQIPKHLHAGADYLSDQKNMLMALAVVPILGRWGLSIAGKDISQYPSIARASVVFSGLSLLGELNNAGESLYSSVRNGIDYISYCYADNKELKIKEIRKEKRCFPTEDHGYWFRFRTLATLSAAISSLVSTYSILGNMGALKYGPSSGLKAAGYSLGVLSLGLDIQETRRKVSQDKFGGVHFSDLDLLDPEDEVKKNNHKELFQKYNSEYYEQTAKALLCGMNIIGFIAAIDKVITLDKGTRLVSDYSELAMSMFTVSSFFHSFFQHVSVGYEKKNLEEVKKDTSQNRVRFLATILDIANGYELSPYGISLDVLSGSAQLLSKTYDPSGAIREGRKLCEKISKLEKESLISAAKCIGKVAGAVSLFATIYSWNLGSWSQTAGWIKNGCSFIAAPCDFYIEGQKTVEAWQNKEEDKWDKITGTALSAAILLPSMLLSSMGYVQNAFPEALKAAPGPDMPKATIQLLALIGSIAGMAKDLIGK